MNLTKESLKISTDPDFFRRTRELRLETYKKILSYNKTLSEGYYLLLKEINTTRADATNKYLQLKKDGCLALANKLLYEKDFYKSPKGFSVAYRDFKKDTKKLDYNYHLKLLKILDILNKWTPTSPINTKKCLLCDCYTKTPKSSLCTKHTERRDRLVANEIQRKRRAEEKRKKCLNSYYLKVTKPKREALKKEKTIPQPSEVLVKLYKVSEQDIENKAKKFGGLKNLAEFNGLIKSQKYIGELKRTLKDCGIYGLVGKKINLTRIAPQITKAPNGYYKDKIDNYFKEVAC